MLTTKTNIPLSPRSYIDNFAVLAISDSLSDNVATLSKGLMEVCNLLQNIGMSIDTEKLDLIHFTRRPKDGLIPLDATIYGAPIRILPKKTMRWLGIYFDKRLTFSDHVKIMSNRASSIINGLRCLANTVRGLSHPNLHVIAFTASLSFRSILLNFTKSTFVSLMLTPFL